MAKSDKGAKQELKDARANLARVAAGTTEETPAVTAANSRVLKAEKAVPWRQR